MKQKFQPDPNLDRLIRRLNDAARENGPTLEIPEQPDRDRPEDVAGDWEVPEAGLDENDEIGRLMGLARVHDASDLLIVAGNPPMLRINGQLSPVEGTLTESDTRTLCGTILPRERRKTLAEAGAVDFAFTRTGLGRFRCNLHRQQGSWAAAIRLLPKSPPDFTALNLPPILDRIVDLNHGLVLVTGPTGSGKSTTLASILSRILESRRLHAITIEDPVEYEHSSTLSLVEHVEVGRDASSFSRALRSALRQDPDVLLVGEMRDTESISMAITAAETGHLVLTTLHTGDAAQSINRIVDSFPPEQAETIRTQLSISLTAIISQHLIPRLDGGGRVPAVEIMFASDAVRNMIRSGKIEQLRGQVGLDRRNGSIPLDHSLASLVRHKLIDEENARLRARNPMEFDALL